MKISQILQIISRKKPATITPGKSIDTTGRDYALKVFRETDQIPELPIEMKNDPKFVESFTDALIFIRQEYKVL